MRLCIFADPFCHWPPRTSCGDGSDGAAGLLEAFGRRLGPSQEAGRLQVDLDPDTF